MVQAYRHKTILNQKTGLSWPDIFSGEDYVATTMNHKSYKMVSQVAKEIELLVTCRLAIFSLVDLLGSKHLHGCRCCL